MDRNARYNRSAKGKARSTRYNRSEKGRARDAAFRATANGQTQRAEHNASRVFAGKMYLGKMRFTDDEVKEMTHGKAE